MGVHLDWAGVGLVRAPARAAMHEAVDEVLAHGAPRFGRFFEAREAARASAARLLDGDPDEVALVPNTSTGLHLVADGLDWRPGDEVVVFDRDFPANVHPWRRLAGRGVTARWVPQRDGGYDLSDVAALVGPATRLVAVSHVDFLTGSRIDLDAVCAVAAEVGALVCVDAVQSLGAVPLSVRRTPVDFVAAGAHKWLGGPPGTGLFYCRRHRLPLLRWAPAGWFGFEGAQDMLVRGQGHFTYDLPLRPEARRVEGGMPNIVGIAGLAAALRELEEAGPAAVTARVAALAARLRGALRDRGVAVLGRGEEAARSGVVTFEVAEGTDPAALVARLADRGIAVSFPDGRIRVSAHFWNDDGDIDAFLDALPPRI